jgi:Predicted nucleotide-binding protein containing TIR -like domain
LELQIQTSDFAVLVLTPDDQVISREKWCSAPRDNAVFELGLFMGALSRSRTFLLTPSGVEMKIPSDLLGLTPLSYTPSDAVELLQAVQPACDKLRTVIKKLGPK